MNIKRIIKALFFGPVAMTVAIAGIGEAWDGEADATADCSGYSVNVKNLYSPATAIIIHTPAPSGTWTDPYKLEKVQGNTAFTWSDSADTDLNNDWEAIEPAECLQTPPTTTVIPAPEPTVTVPTVTVISKPADPIPSTPVVDIGTPAPVPTPAVQGALPVTGDDTTDEQALGAAFAVAFGLLLVLGSRRRNASVLKVVTTEG